MADAARPGGGRRVTPAAPVRRLPLVGVLVLAGVLAAVAGDADVAGPRPAREADPATGPPSGSLTAAWYCPGGVPGAGAEAESLRLANLGDADARVAVTVHPDGGGAPVTTTLEVAARAVTEAARADLGPPGGAVVEAFTGDVVVESALVAEGAVTVEPCATAPATTWYFAAGTTARGVGQHLVLYNPFGSDAKVDVRLYTEAGVTEPDRLRSIDVPRRSRVVVPVHEIERRAQRTAVRVHATLGQVVAEQTLTYGADTGTPGLARSAGAVAPAGRWHVPHATVGPGVTTVVAVANPNDVDADVDVVAVAADPDTLIDPLSVTVPAGRVTWVRIGGCPEPPAPDAPCVPVAADGVVALDVVAAAADLPVVAEHLARFGGGRGVLTSRAGSAGGREWRFAAAAVAGVSRGSLTLVTTGTAPVSADVVVVRGGEVTEPERLAGVEVVPGRPTVVPLDDLLARGTALVVRATGDVVAQRTLGGGAEVTASLGVRGARR
ncbi:MAG: hypothetical protein KatS3mg009_1391 [Acidimicrobiia bacterium]|nr:MAG: hypothetical protein KatS3mg009_1391 [Acidimicrobiia bacterium]